MARLGKASVLFIVSSTRPVISINARLNNVVYASLTGGNVQAAAGINFTAPMNPGMYRLTVDMVDSLGCTYATGTLRQVVVQ